MPTPTPNIHRLLSSLRRRQKALWTGALLLSGAGAVLAVVLLGLLVEAAAWLEPGARRPLALAVAILAGLALLAVPAGAALLWLSRRTPPETTLARWIWAADEEVRDRILGALELARGPGRGASEPLLRAALEQADHLAAGLDPARYVRRGLLRRALRGSGMVAGVFLLALLLAGGSLRAAADRLAHPGQAFLKPDAVLLSLELPRTLTLVQGDSLEVGVRARHALPGAVSVVFDEGAGVLRPVAAERDSADSARFHARIERLERDLLVYARAGRAVSDTARVKVLPRPRIARLEVTVHPPAYTGEPARRLPEGVGDITALPGSRAALRLEASRPLAGATLALQRRGGKAVRSPLRVEGHVARGGFTLRGEGRWWVELLAADSVAGEEPLHWRLGLLEDRAPRVEVRLPEEGAEIPESMTLPLAVVVDDDYGVGRIVLRYRVYNELTTPDSVGEEYFAAAALTGAPAGPGREVVQTLWSLENLPLLPTDEVHYFVEAWDNDGWRGPKRGRSELRRLVFPTMEDLFARSEEQETTAGEEMSQALERARAVKEKLEESLERLRSNPDEMSWEQAQALQQTLETQEKLLEQVQRAGETLDEMRRGMEERDLASRELLEKYAELQKTLEEIATPELREAMERLQEALEAMDGERIRDALQQMAFNQEEMLRSLDRSLAILQQLKAERRLEELAQRAEELARRQEEISRDLQQGESDENARNRAARREERLGEDLAALAAEMDSARAQLGERFPELADSLGELGERLAGEQIPQDLRQAASGARAGEMKQARQSARRAGEKLQQFAAGMRKLQRRFTEQNRREMLAEMDHLFDMLLLLSRREEALRQESKALPVSSPRHRALASRQDALLSALGVSEKAVEELSRRTFFVGSSMLADLAVARFHMESAIQRYTNRLPREVTGEQQEAMAALHRALGRLTQARRDASQSSSGTGYAEMMQRLAQMAQQQQMLNQASQGMPVPVPGASAGQRLAQLAARQRALAGQMRRLEQEANSMEEILGSLEGLGQAMEEVAGDLQDQKVTERTKRLQQRILQRLLDSQRSLQQSGRSRRRISRTGEDVLRRGPGSLAREEEDLLRERMRRALESDYAPRWRELIRDYYRALQRDAGGENRGD